MTQNSDFIRRWTSAVVNSVKGMNLFPSVVMAQMIIESGWGKSQLASIYNNFFGIKSTKNWKGPVVNLNTREVIDGQNLVIQDGFRVYVNPADSIRDRNRFLVQNSRYKKAGVFDAKSPEEQAIALQSAGYATDPEYASTIIRIIKSYNLKALDELAKKKE